MKRKRTQQEQDHLDNVAQYGCMVCGMDPVVLHHCRGGSVSKSGFLAGLKRPSDFLVIPLTPMYHTGERGIHVLGVDEWEAIYGTQMSHLIQLSLMLDYDVLSIAKDWHSRTSKIYTNEVLIGCQEKSLLH